jgi:sugar lactone lactonase YvrE
MIFTMGAVWFAPSAARADLVFTGDDWGTNLYEIDTRAGGWSKVVFSGENHGVNGLGTDGRGNLFVSDFGTRTIRKFTLDGKYTTFATLDTPGAAMAFDGEGSLFLPYQGLWGGDGRIDKFSPDGSSHNPFATGLPQPVKLIFDRQGQLFATDQKSGCIYEFDPDDGTRTTFATGLKSPIGMAFDAHGILFVADPPARVIYKYSTNGVRTTFARRLKSWPCSVAFDSVGDLFMADGIGNIFEFKNAAGKLSSKPVLIASGMGHNFFMILLPGSMPARVLAAKAVAKLVAELVATPWMRRTLGLSVLLLLLVAGVAFLLLRKPRRSAV